MLLFFLVLSLFSLDKFKVNTISIVGNDLTKDVTIRREILFKLGDVITEDDVEYSRKRIENTRLFTSVNYKIEKDSSGVKVIYSVYEKFPMFLSPVVSTDGLNTDKVTYGVKFQHINVAGKRHTVDFTALGGERSIYSFFYNNPWVFGTDRLSYTYFINHSNGDNRLIPERSEKNLNTGISFGKGFGPYISSGISINYNKKTFDGDFYENVSIDESKRNHIFEYSLGIVYDTRDFYNFPTSGRKLGLSLTLFDIKDDVDFSSTRLSLGYINYLSLTDRIILASSADNVNVYGNPFYYHKVYYNSRNIVRGHKYSRSFGENSYTLKNEIRFEFLKDFFWSLNLPYIKKYMTNLRTMMYTYAFFDIGNIDDSFQSLINGKPDKGYGLGFGVILPYMKAIRFELAMDMYKNKLWTLEMGLPF